MGEYTSAQLDAVFGAVADPTRRAILAQLSNGDARVTEVASQFPISLNSVSKHVRMLERAGLVQRTVLGRDHVLSLNADALEAADEWMAYYRKFWTARLEALERVVLRKRQEKKQSTRKGR